VTTLDITAERILDAVTALHEERDGHAAAIAARVAEARAQLLAGERRVAELVRGG
jgi:hypothetical protein